MFDRARGRHNTWMEDAAWLRRVLTAAHESLDILNQLDQPSHRELRTDLIDLCRTLECRLEAAERADAP